MLKWKNGVVASLPGGSRGNNDEKFPQRACGLHLRSKVVSDDGPT